MKSVDVFEPPQGCSSGVCGPDGKDAGAAFATDLEWLAGQNVKVARHNLGHDPAAFSRNPLVKAALARDGLGCLPMILIDGAIAKTGGYLTRDDFAQRLEGDPTAD
ncbi:MAG: arsenic metallochaperone ArsD family protein [Alphaproteobacteria bacterium]|nr:arsenic metallochaperone ArsD family protein [Alphaproteobacteria bacterium]MBM3732061.1 arsenic metallochaperone ArsD family protein [Acidimicrobiia bacterium]